MTPGQQEVRGSVKRLRARLRPISACALLFEKQKCVMRPFSVRHLPLVAVTVLIVCSICPDIFSETRAKSPHVPPAVAHAQAVGRLAGSTRLKLAIGLPLRDPEGLNQFLAQVYDPASPLYRQFLTPEQFTARFGPNKADYQRVLAFARAHGFEIKQTHPNRMLVDVEASTADIEAAFHLNLGWYSHPTESRNFYAPDAEPQFEPGVPLLHVTGLDNYMIPHPASLHSRPPPDGPQPKPASGSGPGGTYRGKDFRGAYARGVTLDGTGQAVGLLEFDGFYQSDITTYELDAALPTVTPETVLMDGFNGSAGKNNVEVALDIVMAMSIAPGAQVIVYEAGPTGFANDILSRMANDNVAKQLSASWTYPVDATTTQLFLQFAAQGQSFFNASGDSGAYAGAVATPADDPNISVVGGTTLNTTGPGGAWSSETTWNWASTGRGNQATGGGYSISYPIPSWQQGLSMTTNKGSTARRNLPDVAMVADGTWVYYDNGSGGSFGGTSISSPLWAGFMALVNQQAVSLGQPTIGFLNPAVYAIGKAAGYSTNFHDITTGNNTNSSSPTLFFAVSGYDLCTGWGTPNGQSLINTLAPRVKAPFITNASVSLVAEGCLTNNGAIDPGETVTVNFSLKNIGAIKTANLVATLQADSGVIAPSAPQLYGVLSSGGAAVTRPFTFTANGTCGDTLVTTLLLQDGTTNLGAVTYNLQMGKPVVALGESFDSVTAPGLPSGWTTSTISNAANWVTSSAAKDAGTLSAFATEPDTPGIADLISPPIPIITASAQLVFRQFYNLETDSTYTNLNSAYDGGVLEIQIGTNAFTDILDAGGSFVVGGYNQSINNQLTDPPDDSPLDGRRVWSGNSGGFITTIVNLPQSAAGQTIQLKWRFGTDSGNAYGGFGWYIDTISVTDGHTCCNSTADLAVGQSVSLNPALINRDLSYTLSITNLGPEPAYNVNVTNLLPANANFASASPGCVFTNSAVQCALGTLPIGGVTNLTITIIPTTADTLTNLLSIDSVTADPASANNSSMMLTPVSMVSPPAVKLQPADVFALAGGSAQFETTAQGAPVLSYQWLFNGTNISAGTNASLILTNVQRQNSGNYWVVITNSFGSITSAVARLTVILPPTISLNPLNVSATNLAVTLDSVPGLTYTLEYKNTLQDSAWTPIVPSVPGTGGPISLQDTTGSLLPSRFYRVRSN